MGNRQTQYESFQDQNPDTNLTSLKSNQTLQDTKNPKELEINIKKSNIEFNDVQNLPTQKSLSPSLTDINSPHWSSGVCDCGNDYIGFCLAFWCPCITYGKNVQALQGGGWETPCAIYALLEKFTRCFF